jgi:3'-phosphoadenosine 5'-phosphosulfate sulfotransferase (PAPS reductase)/FAD synthetase
MESTAALVVDRQRIRDKKAIVAWANTGKQFPEMPSSIKQIEEVLGLAIVEVPRRITFDEFLFERGGIVRKGTTDCSRRMKRGNLTRYMKTFPKPYEWNLGYNSGEEDRAEKFQRRNERSWLHWRFPLIEAGISREDTWDICRKAGFTILVSMYEKMGRFDCFFCGNQTKKQALKVVEYYPKLAEEWIDKEERKGVPFMGGFMPLRSLIEANRTGVGVPETRTKCACFGGDEDFLDDEEDE